jgi:hypothetical protein
LGGVEAAQANLLQGYLAANAATEFGLRHNFAGIRTAADFQRAVPLSGYDDYAASIEATGLGQAGVLTAEPVRMFELSSGSTAASKLIPYTASLKAEFQRGLAPWIYDLYSRDPELKRGPAYWSITPLTDGPRTTAGGIPIGFEADSAYLGALGQRLMEWVLAVPNAVKHAERGGGFPLCDAALSPAAAGAAADVSVASELSEPASGAAERVVGAAAGRYRRWHADATGAAGR